MNLQLKLCVHGNAAACYACERETARLKRAADERAHRLACELSAMPCERDECAVCWRKVRAA